MHIKPGWNWLYCTLDNIVSPTTTTLPRRRFFRKNRIACLKAVRKKGKVFFCPKLQLSDLFVVLIVEVIILHPPSSWPNCCARLDYARSMQTKTKRNNRMCLSLSICLSVHVFLTFLFLSLNVFCLSLYFRLSVYGLCLSIFFLSMHLYVFLKFMFVSFSFFSI